uniref:E3 ubiquitin-protein ligase RGLG2 isoform X2 n=1 Tax=Elaeis guineensis var. tenera TaxID=51953 RepID=A0A6I9QPG2_ELAGV|nr:E3 ubiquitin-protein ligase RGLG2 isoform X2 [Elaeis guineensis]
MGGKGSTETGGSRNIRHPPPHHDRSSYSQEQPYHSHSREWPPYRDYGYDNPPQGYPVTRPYSPPRGYPPQGYPPQASTYPRPPQLQNPSSHATSSHPKLDRRYSKIADNYNSLEQVTEALAQSGLESSNLIVGIDFTKSNEWTGKHSFNRRSLHSISDTKNPYEQAISIIGQTLSAFDEDNLIPCFGFGDASTHDQDVFSFYPDERPCNGFPEALARYREIVPHLRLAGPTSFAPIVEMAMTIVEQSGGQYHVLLIIADGQVTRSVDIEFGQLSSQEQKTVDAIVRASEFPLSIILVGVGDGPWDMMKEFDDNIPARTFDNFQFVNFTAIMSKNMPQSRKETEFALAALMEIPAQYKATIELGILGHRAAKSPERVPLPPPIGSFGAASSGPNTFGSMGYRESVPSYPEYKPTQTTAPAASASGEAQVCPICLSNPRDMAFGCGHQTCRDCGPNLVTCPICRSPIQTRIKLY